MKKLTLSLLLLLAIFTGCNSEPKDTVPDAADQNTVVIASGECFNVEEIKKGGIVKYRYTVYTLDGDELERAFCAEKPKVAQVTKTLLGVRFSDGGHNWTRFFDVENGVVSESFMNSFWSDGTLVAYADYNNGRRMVVCDIFDYAGFRSETEIESPTWNIYVIATQLSEDGKQLIVEYVDGDGTNPDAEIKTVTLPLTDEPLLPDDGEEK